MWMMTRQAKSAKPTGGGGGSLALLHHLAIRIHVPALGAYARSLFSST